MKYYKTSCKFAVILTSLALLVLASPAPGSVQTYPLWSYSVSLDFGGKNVTVVPQQAYTDLNRVMRSTIFKGDDAYDWGGIYLFEQRQGTEREGPDDLLWGLMKNSCKGISVNPGTISGQPGRVAKAYGRVDHGFGQECWGGILEINLAATGTSQYFAIVGHFSNETLNEQFVKTVKFNQA
jgi:hypothetical protein